jgi:hypothetical protein
MLTQVRLQVAVNLVGVVADTSQWPALKEARVAPKLARLIGDHPQVASAAIQCLINLSTDSDFQEQMLELRLVNAVMEALKVRFQRLADCVSRKC